MYFTPEPKTNQRDLFGVGYTLASFVNSLNETTTRLIVIKGLRRTGKTSLLNAGLKEAGKTAVKIDVREGPYHDRQEFLSFVISKIRQRLPESLFRKIIKKISKVGISYGDFSATVLLSNEENALLFFENLNKQLADTFILAFDEVQLLKGVGFDYLFASIFDNYHRIKLVLTGSEIGMLDTFLGKHDYRAPLYGRAYLEIELKRLKPEGTAAFLEAGFVQIHKQVSHGEIGDVIEQLDGIVGWLTQYGWLRYQGISHLQAIRKVQDEGKETVKRELDNFLERRRAKTNYMQLLRFITQGNATWSQFKQSFLRQRKRLSDSQLQLYLKELQDYGFVENTSQGYIMADPLLIHAIRA